MKNTENKTRCAWVTEGNKLYEEYHDTEWGKPVHKDSVHFEFIILESAQAGLSWLTVLKKRENYRKAFANFDPIKVSKYTQQNIEELMKNEGIIRNRMKIEAAINNAKIFINIQKEFGSFDNYIWSYVNNKPIINNFKDIKEIPAKTDLSDRISKDLKNRGFRFFGTTICYAHLQATGIVNDHTINCFCNNK